MPFEKELKKKQGTDHGFLVEKTNKM